MIKVNKKTVLILLTFLIALVITPPIVAASDSEDPYDIPWESFATKKIAWGKTQTVEVNNITYIIKAEDFDDDLNSAAISIAYGDEVKHDVLYKDDSLEWGADWDAKLKVQLTSITTDKYETPYANLKFYKEKFTFPELKIDISASSETVDGIKVSSGNYTPDEKKVITIKIKNIGDARAEDVKLEVNIGDLVLKTTPAFKVKGSVLSKNIDYIENDTENKFEFSVYTPEWDGITSPYEINYTIETSAWLEDEDYEDDYFVSDNITLSFIEPELKAINDVTETEINMSAWYLPGNHWEDELEHIVVSREVYNIGFYPIDNLRVNNPSIPEDLMVTKIYEEEIFPYGPEDNTLYVHSFRLMPLKPGKYTIPSFYANATFFEHNITDEAKEVKVVVHGPYIVLDKTIGSIDENLYNVTLRVKNEGDRAAWASLQDSIPYEAGYIAGSAEQTIEKINLSLNEWVFEMVPVEDGYNLTLSGVFLPPNEEFEMSYKIYPENVEELDLPSARIDFVDRNDYRAYVISPLYEEGEKYAKTLNVSSGEWILQKYSLLLEAEDTEETETAQNYQGLNPPNGQLPTGNNPIESAYAPVSTGAEQESYESGDREYSWLFDLKEELIIGAMLLLVAITTVHFGRSRKYEKLLGNRRLDFSIAFPFLRKDEEIEYTEETTNEQGKGSFFTKVGSIFGDQGFSFSAITALITKKKTESKPILYEEHPVEKNIIKYSPPEGWEERERYWVDEPYSFISILEHPEERKFYYQIVEPKLNKFEKYLLEEVQMLLEDMLTLRSVSDIDTMTVEDKAKLLRDNTYIILKDYSELEPKTFEKIFYYVKRNFIEHGKISAIMHDYHIEDIWCNGLHIPVHVYHTGYGNLETNVVFDTHENLDAFVMRIAQQSGRHLSSSTPILDTAMSDGSRINITYSKEVSPKGSSFTIRRFKKVPITPLDLIAWKTFSSEIMAYFWICMENHKSILFCGGTATGKTSAMNAICMFIPVNVRVVSLEDTREILLPHKNWVSTVTRENMPGMEVYQIDLEDLLRAALRQRPEYLLVGEVRGREAQILFQAMNAGHATCSTFHAGKTSEVINRFTNAPINVPVPMFSALDIMCILTIVYKDGTEKRRVLEVAEVHDVTERIQTENTFSWNPVADYFDSEFSTVLEQIRHKRGWSREDLNRELEHRQLFLEMLIEKGIRDYDSIMEWIQAYYKYRENALANLSMISVPESP